jgi:glycosyltransferase involved in cell wall biosynthesis
MLEMQNWFCAQLGGREHYAVPRALHSSGVLGGMMTDYWAGKCLRQVGRSFPFKVLRSMGARHHSAIPDALVTAWNWRAMRWEMLHRRVSSKGGVAGRYRGYCEVGRRFSSELVGQFQRMRLPANSVFFGYDTGSLEVMKHLKGRGVYCILDQIDPARVEMEMVQAEQRAWPEWEAEPLDIPAEFFDRHSEEWALADKIVVNSEWSRQALIQQGVPETKLAVVPLSYETSVGLAPLENSHREAIGGGMAGEPFRVLFLGQVMLRKGVQYLLEAARLLRHAPVRFDIVGPIQISRKAVSTAPANVSFRGRVTRDEAVKWYRQSNVFVLPTISDGFALTQLEAMSNGLPVIATTHCGGVVTDGEDGFVVPARDSAAIARVVEGYLACPDLLLRQRCAALKKAQQFSLRRLADNLLGLPTRSQCEADTMNRHA